jgi:hypothetical protein
MQAQRGPVFRWFERTVLGAGMTMMAWILERQLLRALKKGHVEPAPRTAGELHSYMEGEPPEPRSGEITTNPSG